MIITKHQCCNTLDHDMANEGGSLGVFDGDDYKTLIEMEEFKSQVLKE